MIRNLGLKIARPASVAPQIHFPRSQIHFHSQAITQKTYVSPYSEFFNGSSNSIIHGSSSSSSSSAISDNNKIPFKEEQFKDTSPKLECGISESVLKFKTTCYDRLRLPPFVQTNEYKVTLKVHIKNLPLETEQEMEIFKQVVGNRFNEELGELKLTSNQFASRIENKRHLCWMLDRIVLGAKGLARGESILSSDNSSETSSTMTK